MSPPKTNIEFIGLLRTAALIALPVGAVGSVALMLRAGYRSYHPPLLLVVIFSIWVLSPFVALVFANTRSRGWSALAQKALYVVTLVVTVSSLVVYGIVALGPPRVKTTPIFVMVPPLSWLLIAIVLLIAAFESGRRARQS